MAVSVTANLTTVSLAESTTGWSGTSGQLDTEVYVQGTTTPASYTYQTGKNSLEGCTFTPATNIDMSGTDNHLYFWMRCDVMPFCEPKRTGTTARSGLCVRVTDGTGNYIDWHVAGSDTWGGEWRCFTVDLNYTTGTEIYASSGTLDLTDVDVITWYTDNSNSGNIRIIDNTWLDAVRFGTGLTATGTSFDFADIAADDALTANKYGVIQNIDGVLFAQGRLTIGSGATTTTLTSDNETVVFRDTFVSSGLYQINFVGSGNTTNITSTAFKGAGSARYVFDADDTNITFTMSGASLTQAGLVSFAASDSITNNVFNNCLQIDPSTSTFQNNTISNYVGTEGGALLFPSDDSNFSDCTFINCTECIEYGTGSDSTSPTFSGHTFDDSTGSPARYDVNNTSGGSVSIAKTNGSNPNSYTGSTVTFTASFTHTLTGIEENTEITYVRTSDDTVLYHVENVSATGTTQYTHGGGETVNILVHHLDYLPDVSCIYDLTLPNSDASVKIQQFADPNYVNP